MQTGPAVDLAEWVDESPTLGQGDDAVDNALLVRGGRLAMGEAPLLSLAGPLAAGGRSAHPTDPAALFTRVLAGARCSARRRVTRTPKARRSPCPAAARRPSSPRSETVPGDSCRRPSRGHHRPEGGVVDVATELPFGVPHLLGEHRQRRLEVRAEGLRSSSGTRNLFTTSTSPTLGHPPGCAPLHLTMVLISIDNHCHVSRTGRRPARRTRARRGLRSPGARLRRAAGSPRWWRPSTPCSTSPSGSWATTQRSPT